MRINWKVRFRNRAWLICFIPQVLSFIYTILATFGIIPKVPQDAIMHLITMLLDILAIIGIITDPTTAGTNDSKLAMSYNKPSAGLPTLEAQFAEPLPEEEINIGDKMNG